MKYFEDVSLRKLIKLIKTEIKNNAVTGDINISVMEGATASKAGKEGLVPAPNAGEDNRYLCSNGTWTEVLTSIFYAGPNAPDNINLLWIDTTDITGGLKYYNGSDWVHVPVAFT